MSLSPSDAAAWSAAAISVISLVWQIVVHCRQGPKILFSAAHNMKLAGGEGALKILFIAYNVGDRPTTLTHLTMECRPTLWGKLLRKQSRGYLTGNHPGQPLPVYLSPGQRWLTYLDESPEVLRDIKEGNLWANLGFDGCKEKTIRIRFKKHAEQAGGLCR